MRHIHGGEDGDTQYFGGEDGDMAYLGGEEGGFHGGNEGDD